MIPNLTFVAEIIIPIVTFILGWGSGVIMTALLYRDHEKRISQMESWKEHHDIWAGEKYTEMQELKAILHTKGIIADRRET